MATVLRPPPPPRCVFLIFYSDKVFGGASESDLRNQSRHPLDLQKFKLVKFDIVLRVNSVLRMFDVEGLSMRV
ncbi:hypothetical protein L1987_66545 [Smallanthus sonchifolius]|uniref:Uncharacterized protein n=1 Tax=Smallanthus sonchifolius TaxID=185202 RepID=A0ACB9BXE5_9ASTR|nr:hypothetical protein L1987_66545 [Smallanthus sonchifolius]